jgi:hypothetical protein
VGKKWTGKKKQLDKRGEAIYSYRLSKVAKNGVDSGLKER